MDGLKAKGPGQQGEKSGAAAHSDGTARKMSANVTNAIQPCCGTEPQTESCLALEHPRSLFPREASVAPGAVGVNPPCSNIRCPPRARSRKHLKPMEGWQRRYHKRPIRHANDLRICPKPPPETMLGLTFLCDVNRTEKRRFWSFLVLASRTSIEGRRLSIFGTTFQGWCNGHWALCGLSDGAGMAQMMQSRLMRSFSAPKRRRVRRMSRAGPRE